MSNLSDLLRPDVVFARVRWQGRRQVLQELGDALARACNLDSRQVFEGLIERERLGSTGVGEGVAIPHARVRGLARPVGGFAKLAEPVSFEAIDERPCDLVFMLLSPEDCGADHLRALARVSRAFRQEQVRAALRRAGSAENILRVLTPESSTDAA